MNKIIVLFLIMTPIFLNAQKSGVIKYSQTLKVEIPDRVPAEFRDRIPKERTLNKELYFNQTSSTYKNGENLRAGEGAAETGDSPRIRFRGRGGDNPNAKTYKDISANLVVDNRDIMGKQFIIEDELTTSQWKMTGQKKTILGYMVMEATTMVNDTVLVTAYFTPQIPVPNGPDMYHGLPGMILEVNVDNGRNIIIATGVELMEVSDENLEKPTSGKKVTREEFEEIRKEKMEKMRDQRGGGRGFRVRTGG